MILRLDNEKHIEIINRFLDKLKRYDKVRIGNELFEYMEFEVTSDGNYNLQYIFLKIGEKPPVALPYRYVIEVQLEQKRIKFYKWEIDKTIHFDVSEKKIEFL